METSVAKKRGRKPKSETLTTSTPVKKTGKLKISLVEEDEEDQLVNGLVKGIDKLNLSSQTDNHDADDEQHQQQIQSQPCMISLDLGDYAPQTTQQLERRTACDNRPGYFHLLQEFSDVYPNKTDVLCWWCCHSFKTAPVGIPMRHDGNLDVFKVVGCFCSMNCAYAHSRKENMKIFPSDFRFMYEKITGTTVEDWNLSPAPERYILKTFGGPLSIDEYRESFYNQYEIMFTPMMPFGMLCDEILGRSLSRGWTKDGIRRPLEIRRAKKDLVVHEQLPVEKKAPAKTKARTTVNHMIAFEDAATYPS